MTFRIAVLVSGAGSLLQALLDAERSGSLPAHVALVGSDRPDAEGLRRAAKAGVPTFVHQLSPGLGRAVWDEGLAAQLAQAQPDLVVLAGFMKLVGPAVLTRFGGRMINTHPALLPSFPGAHGPRDALAHGVKVTGTTIFLVDEGLDTGRIIAQEPVRVAPDDTVDSLHERIKVVERDLLVRTVAGWAAQARERTP